MYWLTYIIESIFSLGLFVNAILFIPQIVRLIRKKNSGDLSLTTFLGFNIIQLFTVFHGYLREDLLLMLGTGLSFITCGCVTASIFIYRRGCYGKDQERRKEFV